MKKVIRALLITIIVFPLFPLRVCAADIDVSIDLTYSVNSQGIMHIKEVRTVTNKSNKFYVPATSQESFIISTFKTRSKTQISDLEKVSQTIRVTDLGGVDLNPTVTIEEDRIEAKILFGRDLTINQSKTFVLEYDNFELAEKNGNVWNIYVPGLPEDYNELVTSTSGATTQTSYGLNLELDKSFGSPNFVLPEPTNTYEITEKRNYVFDPASLVKQSVWVQIGSKQYYNFTITQQTEASTSLGAKVFNNWYDLILPRDSDSGNQNVYFHSIMPSPKYVKIDEEGNVVARFTFEGTQSTAIVIKGYIVSNITEEIQEADVGQVEDIDLSKIYASVDDGGLTFRDLLSSQQYWEVEAAEVQQKAAELKGDETHVLQILLADYNFVTERVDYDNLKTGINNQRQGALSTLKGGSSVCMEYSDLLITLLRAQGIPTRASFGYGFDPKSESETEEGHQWVEVYMPNIGWVAIDPTWGDTGRKSYIGGDVDHALWYVAGLNVETPSPVVRYSFSDNGSVEAPKFEIKAVGSATTNLENLTTLDELLDRYKYSSKHKIQEQFERLNVYGKIIFVVIPGIIALLLIFSLIISLTRIAKKLLSRNYVRAKPASHDVPNNPYY